MKNIKTLLALVVLLMSLTSCAAVADSTPAPYTLGGPIGDFTVTTFDGRTVSLSGLLAEKDMVLINVWATWCGPCRNEFPFMEEAYRQYADDVAIVALSCEPTDTPDVLSRFAADMGLTFHIAQDTVGMAQKLRASAIPTTIVVDRFGTICFRAEGSIPDTASFVALFDAFVGEDYTQSRVFTSLPPMKPNVPPTDEADLAAALGVSAAANVADSYTWPMTVAETDGRTVLTPANQGRASTTAAVNVPVTAATGEAITVTFRTSTRAAFDLLTIALDGQTVKVFGGTHDWMTYAIPVTEGGEHTLTLSYVKRDMGHGGADAVWIDAVSVVSGDEAAAALAANPVLPAADATIMTIDSPTAREIVFADEYGLMAANFGDARYYIVNADRVIFTATLSAETDPEGAFFYSYFDGAITPLSHAAAGVGYAVESGVDSMEATSFPYCYVALYESADSAPADVAVFFRDEANLKTFVNAVNPGTWQYASEARPDAALPGKDAAFDGMSDYVIRYVDQNGSPVAGVMVQVCDEHTCQVYTTDESGVVTFTAPAYAWEIHTLKLPEGFEGDTQTITLAPVEGGEMVFTVNKL